MPHYGAIILLTILQTVRAGDKPYMVKIPDDHAYFTAAVYEHAKVHNTTIYSTSEILTKNLDFYRRAAELAKSKHADIIAFPEYGLLPYLKEREEIQVYLETIPDPNTARWNPCVQTVEFATRPILRNLSCMARENDIVVVVPIGDIQPCTKEQTKKCRDDGFLHHNADIAFDRDGTLLAVYRKEHLFYETTKDHPIEPQNATFHTDFGTFAMYTCFEGLFKKMALSGRTVDGVILNSMWLDSRPLLTSVQFSESWSIGNSANLILPNTQIAGHATVGSGLFNGQLGPLKYSYNIDGLSKLIVSKMPKRGFEDFFENSDASISVITENDIRPYEEDIEDEGKSFPDVCDWKVLGNARDYFKDYRCMQENITSYALHKLVDSEGKLEVCHNGLCCSLMYSTQSMNETFYFGVFNGTHKADHRYTWCEEKCFVLRCDAFNGTECNTFPAHSNTVFRKLEMKSNFSTDFTYPSVVETGYRLVPRKEWHFHVHKADDGYYPASLSYTNANFRPLLVAAINARCYDRDPPYVP